MRTIPGRTSGFGTSDSFKTPGPPVWLKTIALMSVGLELDVFVRPRVRETGDQAESGFLHARPVAVDERELPDRNRHHLLVHELLDLEQQRLALLAVELGGLVLEQRV